MVFIKDGEILQDGDARLQSPSPQRATSSQRSGQGASQPPAARPPVFDFSASPVRFSHEPPGQSLYGLPGLDIFGAHFQSKHLAVLAGLTLFLGVRGFMLGSGIWVIYKLSSGTGGGREGATSSSQQPTQSQGQGQDMAQRVQNLFASPPSNMQAPYQQGSSPWSQPPRQQGGADAQSSSGAWTGRGQGHKLGNA